LGVEYLIYPEIYRNKPCPFFELEDVNKEQQRMLENKALAKQISESILPEQVRKTISEDTTP